MLSIKEIKEIYLMCCQKRLGVVLERRWGEFLPRGNTEGVVSVARWWP